MMVLVMSALRYILDPHGFMAPHLPFWYQYSAMFKFEQVFRQTLCSVKTQYPAARFDVNNRGMTLQFSPPPVAKRLYAVYGRF